MRKRHITLALFAFIALSLVSCLGNDDNEVTYYGDAAISSFTLGTLNRTVHTTTSSGQDSTYKATVTGSNYKFYIDQVNREIYNVDSLPVGTDVQHVVATITAKTGGSILIKSVNSDTLYFYSETDSLDFSVPRRISVYASTEANTSVHTDYTVKVNVHQEESGIFKWTLRTEADCMKNTQGMKAYAFNGHICVFALIDGITQLMCTSETDGTDWSMPWKEGNNTPGMLLAADYHNTAMANNCLYVYTEGSLYQSSDIYNWTVVSHPQLSRLLGGSSRELYGIDKEGFLVASYNGGANWLRERTDAPASLFPSRDINVVHIPSLVNDDTEAVAIIGNRDAETYNDDIAAMVWYKVADNDPDALTNLWMYIDGSDEPQYLLPRLSDIVVTDYDNGFLALGGKGIGACSELPFLRFYHSKNNGLYWHHSSNYTLPSGFNSNSESFALTTDSKQRLWFICGGSGQIWCGGLNEASWTEYPTIYTE